MRLDGIYRYPVKGFAGQEVPEAALLPGRGVPFDRHLAVAHGGQDVAEDGAWTTCHAFVRTGPYQGLPLFGIDFDGAALSMSRPGGAPVEIPLDDLAGAGAELAEWFPGTRPRLVRAGNGYWDYSDAGVSLINKATIASLGHGADPLSFRANFYLSDLAPWSEFGLVGRRVRVGGAELEVLRPIDRCSTTSIHPTTGEEITNVPALMAREHGHIYCGVYARVVVGGRVSPGDPVVDLGPAPGAALAGTEPSNAPPAQQWPRPARVVRRVRESTSVISYWLRDPLAGVRPEPLAGQHVRIHHGGRWRAYTISAAEGDELRISVKRDGVMSGLLHDTAPDELIITGPFGSMCLDSETSPLLLVSAGIGITPMLPMIRAAGDRPVTLLHAAREESPALWAEAKELLPEARLFRSPHRLDAETVAAAADPSSSVYLCGPVGFMRAMREALVASRVPDSRIRQEVFVSPLASSGERTPPPEPGPFRVLFADSGVEAQWKAECGSLLDLAEQAGLSLPSSCRAGACDTCVQRLSGGSTAYLTDPVLAPGNDRVLLCCSVPTSDVIIDA
ncbi:MOSC domain-containing protein [Allokutzneria albata]|uniref:2Fe-2S iron-sulfur cluster binding domain-containing protein n=1 Tax=Allokutzneria albata TaxID=211114 RepID=A0A1G9RDP8_ALLAB|nr:MOSC domain-containing protein [Allokutzneria albata]SDM21343.1 2Fe-2S iron-sulfur cluster binding domain-containing protein [Allokutzneria albata]